MSFIAELTVENKVNIVVHTTDIENRETIKVLLDKYKNFYDGWEMSLYANNNGIKSYRYYYYNLPKKDIANIVQTLHKNRNLIKTRVAIMPSREGRGNYNFD